MVFDVLISLLNFILKIQSTFSSNWEFSRSGPLFINTHPILRLSIKDLFPKGRN